MPFKKRSRPQTGRPRLEVADIFRAYGETYRQHHALSWAELKVMRAIENCRTAILGGHVDVCQSCGHGEPSYNSCRNRHCPKCQGIAQATWIENRQKRILPTHYFHVVFTVPPAVGQLLGRNARKRYDLLLAAASQTLLEFGQSRFGAQIGITAVLHTWTRELKFHPHVHCIVTGGGLDLDKQEWKRAGKRFLFPVGPLSNVFRGKLLDALQHDLNDASVFARLKQAAYRADWVVYAKRPFGGPEQVFNYLGRYTHRVGLSNHRLVSMDDRGICFRTHGKQTVTVEHEEFIRRFLLHVLPSGFVKIRHYGLMAAGNVNTRLEAARALLQPAASPVGPESIVAPIVERDWKTLLKELTGIDPSRCRLCGGETISVSLDWLEHKSAIAPPDSS